MSLVIFLMICFLAGYAGSRYTFVSVKTWYCHIHKPSWTPPDWLFAPVWTVLYVLMALAAWLVWEHSSGMSARGSMLIFGLQLVLNVLWSAIFFGMRNISLAFKEMILLWVAIGAMIVVFASVTPVAGILLIPYWGWVTFALVLNGCINRMNQ